MMLSVLIVVPFVHVFRYCILHYPSPIRIGTWDTGSIVQAKETDMTRGRDDHKASRERHRCRVIDGLGKLDNRHPLQ
jgi:hypothetical protein